MKIIDFIRLLRKHLVLLILTPIILAVLVFILTMHPSYKYASQSSLYTGIATGSSVEMDKSFNYFASNIAFDNLINIIKSRKTQQEVSIRLLSQHLLLNGPNPKYISSASYNEFKKIVPQYIYSYAVKDVSNNMTPSSESNILADTTKLNEPFTFDTGNETSSIEVPENVTIEAYEKTVENLTKLMTSSDTNFVYELFNFPNPHYSFKDISEVKVQRVANSDLVQLNFESDDPGICQQTLAILINVCIRNYRDIKENRSDAVVKYFEYQLKQASARLRLAEDKLLEFNKDNNIINYYEQSKAVAVVKEDLDVEYNNKLIKLAGLEAAIKRLEEKLDNQEQIQLKSTSIMQLKDQLGEINYKIASAETYLLAENKDLKNLEQLKTQAEILKNQIKEKISELYSYGNSKEGLPMATVLNDWLTNVIEAENLRAGVQVLGERIKEFQKQYAVYAPAGANIKRIERGISVSEQEFLEILHGLNLAKLKVQDNELSSNIKVVDPPFYPLTPIPTKRKILIALAAIIGLIFITAGVLLTEYLDTSLKNQVNASRILKLKSLGILPKILLNVNKIPITNLTERLIEIILQNIKVYFKQSENKNPVKTLLFFSTQMKEGKSVVAANLALQLKNNGKKVLLLNYANESLLNASNALHMNDKEIASGVYEGSQTRRKSGLLSRLLGYPDSRIDYNNPFLSDPKSFLNQNEYMKYQVGESFLSAKHFQDLIPENVINSSKMPEYVLIELPEILYHSYPTDLIADADLPILVCRSNRNWTEADQNALEIFLKFTSKSCQFILNGVDMEVIESVLGELPKKRSWLRKAVKKLILFQFLSKNRL